MNCVQKSMLSGSPNAGSMEKTADCCNFVPAQMWRRNDLEIVQTVGQKNFSEKGKGQLGNCYVQGIIFPYTACKLCCADEEQLEDSFSGLGPSGEGGAIIIGCCVGIPLAVSALSIMAYVTTSVLAAPCLAFGACFKAIALNEDAEAAQYHEDVIKYLDMRKQSSCVKKLAVDDLQQDIVDIKRQMHAKENKLKEIEDEINDSNNIKIEISGNPTDELQKKLKATLKKEQCQLEGKRRELNTDILGLKQALRVKELSLKDEQEINDFGRQVLEKMPGSENLSTAITAAAPDQQQHS
jgi:hypothetical protein